MGFVGSHQALSGLHTTATILEQDDVELQLQYVTAKTISASR